MKKKIYLELGITLIVGFMIGFFANAMMTNKRIQSYAPQHGQMMFWKKALNDISATPEQRQVIMPIIKEHKDEARKILQQSWQDMNPIWNNMEREIIDELTPEQQVLMKDIIRHHKHHLKKRQLKLHKEGKRHHPAPHERMHQQHTPPKGE